MSFDINNLRIGIVGLGYVGLPLAVEFGKKYPTVGFDIKTDRVAELEGGTDSTLECSSEELAEATQLSFASDSEALDDCNFYIVTVPTPIGDGNRPRRNYRRPAWPISPPDGPAECRVLFAAG